MKLVVQVIDSGCDLRRGHINIRARRYLAALADRSVDWKVEEFTSAEQWLSAEPSFQNESFDLHLVFLHGSDPGWEKVVSKLAERNSKKRSRKISVGTYSGSPVPSEFYVADEWEADKTPWWKHYSKVFSRWDFIEAPERAAQVGLEPHNPAVEEQIAAIFQGTGTAHASDQIAAFRSYEVGKGESENERHGQKGLRHVLLNAVGPLRQATEYALATGGGITQFKKLWDHLLRRIEGCKDALPPSIVLGLRQCEANLLPKLVDGQIDPDSQKALAQELALIEAFGRAQDRPRSTRKTIEAALVDLSPGEPVRILWVDDEEPWFDALEPLFSKFNIKAEYSTSPETRFTNLNDIAGFDAIVLDLILENHGEGIRGLLKRHQIPGADAIDDNSAGLGLLQLIQSLPQPPATFILSARDSPTMVRACTVHGARNYFVKGQDDELSLLIELQREGRARRQRRKEALSPRNQNLVVAGEADPLANIILWLDRIATGESRRAVLLVGEPGVGKGELAEEFHLRSPRRRKELKVLDCSTITPTLIESELFGHKKGSFNDASSDRQGLIEQGRDGIVFLDEVDKLSPEQQNRLLRFIDTRKIRGVGYDEEHLVDALLILGSNADPSAREGKFSEPFVSRLKEFTFRVPPLRSRPTVIDDLVRALAARVSTELERDAPQFTAPAVQWIRAQIASGRFDGDGGNIRGLSSLIERVLLFYPDRQEFGLQEFQSIDIAKAIPTPRYASAVLKAAQTIVESISPDERVRLQDASTRFEAALLHGAILQKGREAAKEFFGLKEDNFRKKVSTYTRKGYWPSDE